jgi:hypothetical protein
MLKSKLTAYSVTELAWMLEPKEYYGKAACIDVILDQLLESRVSSKFETDRVPGGRSCRKPRFPGTDVRWTGDSASPSPLEVP